MALRLPNIILAIVLAGDKPLTDPRVPLRCGGGMHVQISMCGKVSRLVPTCAEVVPVVVPFGAWVSRGLCWSLKSRAVHRCYSPSDILLRVLTGGAGEWP